MDKCPCCSGKDYQECCEPFHKGKLPETPLQLMRSRYTAYALGLSDYIVHTTYPRSAVSKKEIDIFCEKTTFQRLEVIDSDATTVTFIAHLKQGEADATFAEKSYFQQIKGKWYYNHPQK